MKNKKWLLLLIILFPSVFWLILESSTINSRRLPHYGPGKKVGEDSVFYSVGDLFFNAGDSGLCGKESLGFPEKDYPVIALMFVGDKYRVDSYRLGGLWEYLKYKKEKVEHIPFILVAEADKNFSLVYKELKALSQNHNVHFASWPKQSFDSLVNVYFNGKPYYIDHSFFMLIDGKRHVRGYYDGRYVAEIKRLAGEYQHLRLKEEKQKLIDESTIKTNP